MSGNSERKRFYTRGPLGYKIWPCLNCGADKWIFILSEWNERNAEYIHECLDCGERICKLYFVKDLEKKGIVR